MADVGRPSKYKPEYAEQVYKLCLLNAIDKDIADFFDVSESTVNLWKLEHEEFSESIKRGKLTADSNVAESLYKRACGYEHEEDAIFNDKGTPLIVPTIKHYPPDTGAAMAWLKNRQSAKWRDKIEVDSTLSNKDGKPFEIQSKLSELSVEELKRLAE